MMKILKRGTREYNSATLRAIVFCAMIVVVSNGCVSRQGNNPTPACYYIYASMFGPTFHGLLKIDPADWNIVDSTTELGGLTLNGISEDGSTLFASGRQYLFEIDAATLTARDSLQVPTDNASFLLIPEERAILRADFDTLDVIALCELGLVERRMQSYSPLSWEGNSKIVVASQGRKGSDSVVVLYDYRRDSVLHRLTLRGRDGLVRTVYHAVLDPVRNRVLAIGRRGRGWFMAFDLETDSCLFQKSIYGYRGDIIFSSNSAYCYVSNPGDLEIPGGKLYKLDADNYQAVATFTEAQAESSTSYIAPGRLTLSPTEDLLFVAQSEGRQAGPITVLEPESLSLIRFVRFWDLQEQIVTGIVLGSADGQN